MSVNESRALFLACSGYKIGPSPRGLIGLVFETDGSPVGLSETLALGLELTVDEALRLAQFLQSKAALASAGDTPLPAGSMILPGSDTPQ